MRALAIAAGLLILLAGCDEVFMGNIEFPLAGVDRSTAFQRQRPYTTPAASNVSPFGSTTGRGRGGSRPGLVKVTSGTPAGACKMLASVMPLDGTLERSWGDDFENQVWGDPVDQIKWPSVIVALPYGGAYWFKVETRDGRKWAFPHFDGTGATTFASAQAQALTIDSTEPYVFTLQLKAFNVTDATTSSFYLYLGMNDAAPTANNCICVSLNNARISDTVSYLTGTIQRITSGGFTANLANLTAKSVPSSDTYVVTVLVNDLDVTVYLNGESVGTLACDAIYGTRFGIACARGSAVDDRRVLIDSFSVNYKTTGTSLITDYSNPLLYTVQANDLYQLQQDGSLAVVGGGTIKFTDNRLQAVQYHGKLYIADYSDILKEGTAGVISDGSGGVGMKLSDGAVDFTTFGIDKNRDVCVLTGSARTGTPVQYGAFKITTIAAGSLTLDLPANALDSGVTYKIEAGPKVYDPATNVLSLWTQSADGGVTQGIMPTGCPIIGVFRERMVLIKNKIISQSRIYYPDDWDTGGDPDDPAKAVAGTALASAQISADIRAFAPFQDDTAVYGCNGEVWLQSGDFGEGGVLLNVSRQVGIVGPSAFCYTDTGALVFLSSNGLYSLSPGSRVAVAMSEPRLPRELKGIELSAYIPLLEWDGVDNRIHIYLTPIDALTGVKHWYYDMRSQGFYMVELPSAQEPFCVALHQPYGVARRSLLLGCRDGHIRRYDHAANTDDGTTLTSYVLLGPFRAGDASVRSMWQSVTAILGSTSADVTWTVYAGDSPEQAFDNYEAGTSRASGTWSAGRNTINRPKVSGQAFFLKLSSTGRWEMEEIVASIVATGAYRPG